MYENKRKTIGVFIRGLSSYFQRILCTGIMKEGKKLGYNVAIFTFLGSTNEEFMNGAKKIFDLPDYENFDGVILALDTMESDELSEYLLDHIRKRCNCPVFSIRQYLDEFYNIMVDDVHGMDVMVNHFVEYHGFKDICFVAGKVENPDSERRLKCFHEVMAEHNLPVSEEQIYHGNFWKDDGAPACKQFIDERGKLPDAIICANDYMAISVCNELIERGLSIPEDVAVCGFDGIWETTVCAPSLSTIQVPFEEMGRSAVQGIVAINEKKDFPKTTHIPVKMILRESCGCMRPDREELLAGRRNFYNLYEAQKDYHIRSTFMSISLEEIETLEELTKVVGNFRVVLRGMKYFHICLCSDIKEFSLNNDQGFSEEMYLAISISGSDQRECRMVKFNTSELLPKEVTDEEPQAYIFLPLHYKENIYGYTAICFEDDKCFDALYRTWMINLGNALYDMMVRMESNKLYEHLENSYVHDALTGLYNRRGFSKYAQDLMERAKTEDKYFFVLAADMDKLKYINDTFGHAEGDRALIAMSRALEDSATEDVVCARMGGDEFSVAGLCNKKEDANAYVERLEEKRKQYGVEVSYGMIVTDLNAKHKLEYYMNISDYYMYQDKVSKREH